MHFFVFFFCLFGKELKACEEKHNQTAEQREEIEEAIVWYNKVLGLRIECGHGMYILQLLYSFKILEKQTPLSEQYNPATGSTY